MNTEKRPKQTEAVLEYMRLFGSITPLDALRELGCMRLASRISDLKHEGYTILGEMDTAKNYKGETVRFKRYRLA